MQVFTWGFWERTELKGCHNSRWALLCMKVLSAFFAFYVSISCRFNLLFLERSLFVCFIYCIDLWGTPIEVNKIGLLSKFVKLTHTVTDCQYWPGQWKCQASRSRLPCWGWEPRTPQMSRCSRDILHLASTLNPEQCTGVYWTEQELYNEFLE